MSASTPGPKSASSKPKSPATPAYSLQDSVGDAKKLYDKYSHASFSRAEIASSLGISSSSSANIQRVFALLEYGLITGGGDSFKITDRFHSLNTGKRDTETFKRAALDAIKAASVFADLLSDFKTKLPDRPAIVQRLETQKKFTAERAKLVAGVLEKSLQFANVLDANNNIVPIRTSSSSAADEKPLTPETTASGVGVQSTQQSLPVTADARKTEVPLAEGRVAVVFYPHDLSVPEAEKIGRVLSALVG